MSTLRAAPLPALHLESGLPLRITPREPGTSLDEVAGALREVADSELERCGGLLISGFSGVSVAAFQALVDSFGHPPLSYEFGSTPRSKVSGGVYTSTEFPAHRAIPLHNEQAYTDQWPMRIWFHCAQAAESGGQTPIADSRDVYRRIDPALRERFAQKRLMYVRNYGNGLDVAWEQVFNTDDRAVVERYCHARRIECEWKSDGELRTRQRCQGVAHHPRTREAVWFNQAHLFHISALDEEMREVLFETVGEEDLPRNVYYADGTPLENSALDEIRGVLQSCEIVFPWASGDILLLDNMLTAHARAPFSGPRRVVVAMTEGHGEAMAAPGVVDHA